jgi:hypothetical protein
MVQLDDLHFLRTYNACAEHGEQCCERAPWSRDQAS